MPTLIVALSRASLQKPLLSCGESGSGKGVIKEAKVEESIFDPLPKENNENTMKTNE